jgi:hypothetical protein
MAFAEVGAGMLLADMFDRALTVGMPEARTRGQALMVVTDIGGSHTGQLFETYSFLVLDLDRNGDWLSAQKTFRSRVLRSSRRMAFKALNDRVRRRALDTFLQIGNEIDGWLVSFAISKNGLSLFEHISRDAKVAERLVGWKRPVHERLLRVLHLSAFLISGLSVPRQDVLWVIDQDEVASNVEQLTRFTDLFGMVVSNSLSHELGNIRCATAKSDDGTRSTEDLLSYCDLTAGAVSEATTAMAGGHRHLRKHIVAPLPSAVSWKSRKIIAWLGTARGRLRNMTCLIELGRSSPVLRCQLLHWHALPGLVSKNAVGGPT